MPFRSPSCWPGTSRKFPSATASRLPTAGAARRQFSQLAVSLVLAAAWSLLPAGCRPSGEQPSPKSAEPAPRILTTVQPLWEMAAAVAGNDLQVQSIVPPNRVARTWRPSADDVQSLQTAQLVLLQGAGYEPWRERITLPGSRTVDTSAAYSEQLIEIPDATVHQHGPGGLHSHPGTVWSTWLDPELALAQLDQVQSACSRLRPEQSAEFARRAAPVARELRALDDLLLQLKAQNLPEDFAVLGDGAYFLYLTRRLGWKLHYLHWPEATADLQEQHHQELLEKAPQASGRLLLMRQGRADTARQWAEAAGLKVVEFDLCERRSDSKMPVTQRLRQNLERLQTAIQTQSASAASSAPRTP